MAAASEIDFASGRLAIQLEKEDIMTDLNKVGNPSLSIAQRSFLRTWLVALDTQDVELQQVADRYARQRIQQSMYRAMLADSGAIEEGRREEQQALTDRAEAARLSGRAPPPVPVQVRQQLEAADYGKKELAKVQEIVKNSDAAGVTPGSRYPRLSNPGLVGENGKRLKLEHTSNGDNTLNFDTYIKTLQADEADIRVECVVCTERERTSLAAHLRCSHTWCGTCLTSLFEEAIKDEGVWPPKCCRQDMSLESVGALLSDDLQIRFATKSNEWSTIHRLYCHSKTCSTFIAPGTIKGRKGACLICTKENCADCKGPYHAQMPCPEVVTEEDRMFEQMAQSNKWPRCPTCHRYVQLAHSCNHITCRCKTQFCYECSGLWKTCTCPQWEETRLTERAERVAVQQNRVDVAMIARELEAAHECEHLRWGRSGRGRCDECDTFMGLFRYRCRGCQISVCRQCRFGRVQHRA